MILFLALGAAAALLLEFENGPVWGLVAGVPLALLVPKRGSGSVRTDDPDRS
ncbi:MAG: hypothetical protein ACE5JG_02260 [Planctomycetota bacterium]